MKKFITAAAALLLFGAVTFSQTAPAKKTDPSKTHAVKKPTGKEDQTKGVTVDKSTPQGAQVTSKAGVRKTHAKKKTKHGVAKTTTNTKTNGSVASKRRGE
ncbi:MAG TPA: hypothetical protein VM012_10385 [Flavitalea sp.]|nr:hypothetical protein [Flavitalea sp.]